ncbi:hypothetical protein GMORB2_4103 [Geosmithia morbida]|uniref:Rhodopsin domain-containing protein n=1 Tax=Geosmithia morbida TaxID=1094350 RepID=A0A9P4Z0X9_9HYPO|nr:uncharacterized protein GMORB2_4103 [Geosmithia morbida]KAF4125263.1 hypothetical protein GMORB2_4103 [Geosmithia morbida]
MFDVLGFVAVVAHTSFDPGYGCQGRRSRPGDEMMYSQVSHWLRGLASRAAEYVAYFQICHALCVPLIKTSIAVALVRIAEAKRYRFPLYSVMLASTVLCFAGWISLVSLCNPTATLWNPQLGTCGNYEIITKISYVVSIVTIVTDWTCAIIPFFVLRKLQVSMRTKSLLLFVLGMGVLASVASAVRYPWLKYYDVTTDALWYTSHIIIWCVVEGGLDLLAGSLPSLHKLRTIIMRRKGTQNSQSGLSQSLNGSGNRGIILDPISRPGKHGHGNHSTFAEGGEWDRLSDGTASGKLIIQSHSVHATRETSGERAEPSWFN